MDGVHFYEYVAALLQESGHMVTSSPVYLNHSSQETLYLDSANDVAISRIERNILAAIENVSLLVELKWPGVIDELTETVNIYSITVDFLERTRSQNVVEIHRLLREYWSCNHSIVFFKNKEAYAISFADKEQAYIISDWFPISADYDDIVSRIHITNISLNSCKEYFTDFIYAMARDYYIHPISFEEASFGMIPLSCIASHINSDSSISADEIRHLIRNNMKRFEFIYDTDYVESIVEGQLAQHGYNNILDEIERISLELEFPAEAEGDEHAGALSFEFEYENENDASEDDIDDDIDLAIFDDPVLMVKWLQKKQRQSENNEIDAQNK